ncbi:MAG: hypothetical protein ACMUJM_01555 [bacterium]
MKRKYFKPQGWLIIAIFLFLAIGCSHSYKALDLSKLPYSEPDIQDNVELSYYPAALSHKYGEKAQQRGISVIGVHVTNKTGSTLTIRDENLRITANDVPVTMLSAQAASYELKQLVWPYILYSPLFITINKSDDSQNDGDSGTFIPIGIPISLFNMMRAWRANKNLEKDFTSKELRGAQIAPGETVDGLVFLRDVTDKKVKFQFIHK